MKARDALGTPLCGLLGIRHALLLAGMAGGPNTPELVSEVSRCGGLGVLGVTGMTVDAAARATCAAIACAAGGPVGVNVQLALRTPPTGDPEAIAAVLAPFREELGLPRRVRRAAPCRFRARAARDRHRSRRVGRHDVRGSRPGDPACAPRRDSAARDGHLTGGCRARSRGRRGRRHRAGHRGRRPPQRVRRRWQRHAARGRRARPRSAGHRRSRTRHARGRDRRHHGRAGHRSRHGARRLGRLARHTLPLCARERHRRLLPASARRLPRRRHRGHGRAHGRPARWIRNRFVDAVVAAQAGTLGWGAQGASIAEIRRAAAEQERVDILPMLAGQGAALASYPQPAAEIVAHLLEQTQAASS